ncbi:MAG TPA: GYD domain-containing protein [Amycolatopsis sp.]|nr:GYD domain-containing protein [Amycolatopsis sp.]
MSKFALFFSYTAESWAKMMANPSDRTAAIRVTASALGGSVESFYYMFGKRDGFVVFDLPGNTDAAAIAVGVSSTGAFETVQTYPLIDPADLGDVLAKAKTTVGTYNPPGK